MRSASVAIGVRMRTSNRTDHRRKIKLQQKLSHNLPRQTGSVKLSWIKLRDLPSKLQLKRVMQKKRRK